MSAVYLLNLMLHTLFALPKLTAAIDDTHCLHCTDGQNKESMPP